MENLASTSKDIFPLPYTWCNLNTKKYNDEIPKSSITMGYI